MTFLHELKGDMMKHSVIKRLMSLFLVIILCVCPIGGTYFTYSTSAYAQETISIVCKVNSNSNLGFDNKELKQCISESPKTLSQKNVWEFNYQSIAVGICALLVVFAVMIFIVNLITKHMTR